LPHCQIVRENRKAPNTKVSLEKANWLLRKTRGKVITLEMIELMLEKSVIRSQAPNAAMIGYGEGSETKW
jgi:hypothetical protein